MFKLLKSSSQNKHVGSVDCRKQMFGLSKVSTNCHVFVCENPFQIICKNWDRKKCLFLSSLGWFSSLKVQHFTWKTWWHAIPPHLPQPWRNSELLIGDNINVDQLPLTSSAGHQNWHQYFNTSMFSTPSLNLGLNELLSISIDILWARRKMYKV